MSSFAKLSVHVICHELALDHCQQVAVVITDNEPHGATTPSSTLLKLIEPDSVLLGVFVEADPWAADE